MRKGSFASKEILWLAKTGISQGSNGRFNGTAQLTRQDMAIFLYRFAKLAGSKSAADFMPTDEDYARFKDVKRGTFASKEILWLADERITLGNADGTFGGNSKLSREAMAAFLYRLHGRLQQQ